MNENLKELYENKWNDLLLNAKETDATHPLLIKVDNRYENADIKVMIVGQETDGWCGSLEDKKRDVQSVQNTYFNYLYKNNKKYNRPFWNRNNFRYFKEEITKMFPEKEVAFIWNNISKIGKNSRGEPTKKIENLEKKYFDVFEEELKILNPDIIIFRTGSRKIPIEHKRLKPIKDKPVSEVELINYSNTIAVRTYHPNARVSEKKRFKKEMLELINSLKEK